VYWPASDIPLRTSEVDHNENELLIAGRTPEAGTFHAEIAREIHSFWKIRDDD